MKIANEYMSFFKNVSHTVSLSYDQAGAEYSFYDLKDYSGMDLDDYRDFISVFDDRYHFAPTGTQLRRDMQEQLSQRKLL